MSRFGADYHVARATGRCSATDQSLAAGTACIATLCERPEDEGFDRLDFSVEAWESGARPAGLFSWWRTIVPASDAKPKLLVDDAVLMDLFERLGDDERPQRIAFRFVLALILMRKKLLKFVGRDSAGVTGEANKATHGTEQWLMQPRGTDPGLTPIRVINPNLADADVRELIDQLSEVLQSEL